MADGRHFENSFIAISQPEIIRCRCRCRLCFQGRLLNKIPKFCKFKMANGHYIENGFIARTQPGIVRFQRNLVCSRKLRFQGQSHDKVPQFCKFNMADGRHNENRFSAISGRFIFCLTRNFVQRSIITLRQIMWPKYSSSRHLNRDNKTTNIN